MTNQEQGKHGRQLLVKPTLQPPAAELPVVLATPDLTWRGEGIVVAIPSLLVYSTGAELLIMCRTRKVQPRTNEHVRATGDKLAALTANGIAVSLLGGEYQDHGFTYRAWVPFALAGRNLIPDGDLTFDLGWPEVEPVQHQVTGIPEAARRAVVLW